jgi:hypothetical protein
LRTGWGRLLKKPPKILGDITALLAPLLGVALLVIGLGCLAIDSSCHAIEGPTPAADAKIIEDFAARRAEYEELASMFQADTQLSTIRADGTGVAGEIAGARLERYRTLLSRLQVKEIDRRGPVYGGQSGAYFIIGSYGMVSSGQFCGVLYSEHEPSPVVANTLNETISSEHAFAKIEGNWYVWREWW